MLRFSINLLKLVILLFLLICCLESAICNARKGKQGRHRRSRKQEPPQQNIENSSVFNVLDYGAKGDGTTDDTKVR